MSEKEQKIIKSISDALPKMSDFDKGYFLGGSGADGFWKREKGNHKNNSGTRRGGGVGAKEGCQKR